MRNENSKKCRSTKNCAENNSHVRNVNECTCGDIRSAELTKTKCRAGSTAREKSERMREEFEAGSKPHTCGRTK